MKWEPDSYKSNSRIYSMEMGSETWLRQLEIGLDQYKNHLGLEIALDLCKNHSDRSIRATLNYKKRLLTCSHLGHLRTTLMQMT